MFIIPFIFINKRFLLLLGRIENTIKPHKIKQQDQYKAWTYKQKYTNKPVWYTDYNSQINCYCLSDRAIVTIK